MDSLRKWIEKVITQADSDKVQFTNAVTLVGDVISGRVTGKDLTKPHACSRRQLAKLADYYKAEVEPLPKKKQNELARIGKALVVGGSTPATKTDGIVAELNKAIKALSKDAED